MATLTFPDVEVRLADVTGAKLRLVATGPGIVHHLYLLGGAVQARVFRTDRATIDTYGPSRDATREAAEEVMQTLTARFVDDQIDGIRVEVAPHSVPYVDESVHLYQATYRVDTRPIAVN